MFAPKGANSPPARRSRAIRIHFGGLRPSKPLTAGAGAGPGGIRHLLPQAAFLASEGRSKRLRATCRCSPAPMARAVGTATRLPRRERAHASAPLPAGTTSMPQRHPPPAPSRVSCSLRSLATLTAAHPAPICVRRKGGPCHSERRAGMGPARKRAATRKIPRTARAAAHGGRTCEPTRSERRQREYRAQHEPRPLQGRGTCEPTRKEGSHQPCSD